MARIIGDVGDVLIVRTTKTYTVHVVGLVTQAGQRDLNVNLDRLYERDYDVAVARAKALVLPGKRILANDIDRGEWSVISG